MSEYLKIKFKNLEPVRVADDSTSQSGQTVTLRYIPGTALRGVVVNELAQRASACKENFESIKKSLLSTKVRFLNAYLTDGDRELLPSPKGFYEDKTQQQKKKEIDNVVCKGEFEEGKKRAALGRFCYMEGDCLSYYQVHTGSDLKIKINDEKQNVFRHEYICAGYTFTGYIAVDDSLLKNIIKSVFDKDFVVGNARFAGLGKCRVISCEYTDQLPYEEYMPTQDQEKECYMMLLSNTVMRDENGEICGLDWGSLAEKMGVSELQAAFCATSTIDVKGHNRKWGTKIPSAIMYEQGSVFHLAYSGTLTTDNMRVLCDRGIGIRLNEGFGRILFLKEYEKIRYKEEQELAREKKDVKERQYKEDEATLAVIARCYYRNLLERKTNAYVVEHPLPKGKLANSQLGVLESFTTAYKYEPQEAKRLIEQYLEHALDKEKNSSVQKERKSIEELSKYINKILHTKLEDILSVNTRKKESVMGIAKDDLINKDEILRWKLALITKMIRYDNKREGV